MRFRAFAVALGLGALAATPCRALTVQSAPPRPDVAQHLRSQAAPASGLLPPLSELRDNFDASGRALLREGSAGGANGGTAGFGQLRDTPTTTPGYGATWTENGLRRSGNPWSLTPTRP